MKKISSIRIALLVCFTAAFTIGTVSCSNQMDSEAAKAALKAADIAACNNLMSLHAWYHSASLNDIELEKIWVKKTPDPVWAQSSEYWIGMDSIKAYYGPSVPYEKKKGGFGFHTITTGAVEIAEDRQTAKGVWYTPGVIGQYPNGTWIWERYGVDFAREDGEWKIWHLHVYGDIMVGFEASAGRGGMGASPGAAPQGMTAGQQDAPQQVEKFGREVDGGTAAPMVAADVTAEKGYKEWSTESYQDLIPRPPEPYKTFSETWSYGDPNEVAIFSGPYKEYQK